MKSGKLVRTSLTFGAIVMLALGTGGAAYGGERQIDAVPPVSSSEEVRDDLAKITDPAARLAAEAALDKAAKSGAEVLSIQAVAYEPVSSGSSIATMALPAGCGMAVMVSRSGLTVTNITSSTCTSGNWSTAQHDMRLVATHPITFQQWTKASATRTIGATYTFQSSVGFTCPNGNSTRWSANSKGYMNKGGVNYATPWVYDSFDSSQPCGV